MKKGKKAKPKVMWAVMNEDGSYHIVLCARSTARKWVGSHQRVVRVSVTITGKG